MFWSTGLVLLLAISQVPAALVKPEFIENVIEASEAGERIISGWEALPGQIPYHAALRLMSSTGAVRNCSGSVISREWVITTAQCSNHQVSAVVYAGLISFTNPLPEYISETREIYIHPSFVSNPSLRFDISIIKLQKPLTYTRFLQPIRLQSRADAFRNYEGERVVASGFGATRVYGPRSEVLRWVYLTAVSNRECTQTYSTVTENTICARYYNVTNQNTCNGDNGGPLVHVDSDGVDTLIGITSFFHSTSGCDSTRPNGFIRPGPFHSWLEEVTGIDFENLDESTTLQPTTELATTPLTTEPEPSETTEFVPSTTEPAPSETTEFVPSTTEPEPSETTEFVPSTTEPEPSETTEFVPSTTEPEPSETTEAPETTQTDVPTTTRPPKPPTTPEPEGESEEDGSSEEEDPGSSDLLKKLIVKVKVKVNVNTTHKKKVK